MYIWVWMAAAEGDWRNHMKTVCGTCMHHCGLEPGQKGRCMARMNREGVIICETYGRVTSLALDPIEKKPLKRFHPGSRILSVGSYGCNLSCPFCQNHEISMAGREEIPTWVYLTPEELAAEVGIGRVLPHAAGELGGNLAPELRGGGAGVGDDQEVVDVMPLLRHIAEEALHQDPGLAGPGGGGNQQAPAPVLHGGSLLGGEGHVTPPPFLRFPARTPPALPGGCTGSGPRPFPPGSGRRGPSRNSGRGCPPPCGSRGPRQ